MKVQIVNQSGKFLVRRKIWFFHLYLTRYGGIADYEWLPLKWLGDWDYHADEKGATDLINDYENHLASKKALKRLLKQVKKEQKTPISVVSEREINA
jgi:hypothetical protein